MTIYYNIVRWWGTITRRPNIMVVHIQLLTNLSISQKASLRSLYIDISLWPKSMPQSKEGILENVYQGNTNTYPILYPTHVTMLTYSANMDIGLQGLGSPSGNIVLPSASTRHTRRPSNGLKSCIVYNNLYCMAETSSSRM